MNHCNVCGNEWNKSEVSYSRSRESTMNEILDLIYKFFDDGKDNNLDELKKFSARAVKIFIGKHNDGYKAEKLKKLSKHELKKYGCL